MEKKSHELWEEIYGAQEYAFDFANQLMIKKEYKTDSLFAWDQEQYDLEDEKSFIANLKTLKHRNKQSIFEIDQQKYIVTKNPNYSYSILTTDKINDEKCPVNFDIFLNHKINNYQKVDYGYIIITTRKMSEDISNIFNSYIIEYFKNFKELVSFDLDNKNLSRTEIKFQFLVNEHFTNMKILELALTISSLMPLIIKRLSALELNIWDEQIPPEEKTHWNIFVISTLQVYENYFALKNVKTLGMITSFENLIFIDRISKEIVEKQGNFSSNFTKAKNAGEEGIYEYKFLRNDIADYNKIIFSK